MNTEQTILIIRGLLSREDIARFKNSLPIELSENSIVVFADYSQADFPINQQFTKIFSLDDRHIYEDTLCEIIAVTQQFDKPMDIVPSGWKTVCVIDFPDRVPELVSSLAYGEFETWGSDKNRLGLSTDEVWDDLIAASYEK